MPSVQHGHTEVFLKIVYYGPGLGGKTSNLQYLHSKARPNNRGKLLSLETGAERTLFFELMPVELGTFKDYKIRLHLCTVPGQIAHDETRRRILRHVDGVVFVVDSQTAATSANIESSKELKANLALVGEDATRMPTVVQFNKRDLPGVLSVEQLREALDINPRVPQFEASTVDGYGISATLKAIVRTALEVVGDPAKLPEGRTHSILPGKRASMFPDSIPQAAVVAPRQSEIRAADSDDLANPSFPKPGRVPTMNS